MVVIYKVYKIVLIGIHVGDEACILQRTNKIMVWFARVPPFEIELFLVWGIRVDSQVRECLAEFKEKVA